MIRAGMQEIIFEYDTPYGMYRDALYFPNDQPLPPEAEIKAMELERVNNWIAIVGNPPQPPDEEMNNG